jgi:hypothetical protein
MPGLLLEGRHVAPVMEGKVTTRATMTRTSDDDRTDDDEDKSDRNDPY